MTGLEFALDLLKVLGRLAIAAMFLLSAIDKLRVDPHEVRMIAALHLPAPRTLERLTGAFEVLAASALILGFYGRVMALVTRCPKPLQNSGLPEKPR